MIKICDHTIDETLLTKNSKVIDFGCRNFQFSKGILDYVDQVYAMDADKDIPEPDDERIKFLWGAVAYKSSASNPFVKYGNGTGNFIQCEGDPLPQEHTIEHVPVFSLQAVSAMTGIDYWDLMKLDVEGCEYDILNRLEKPVAKQITFELHEHTSKKVGLEKVEQIFEKLKKFYDFVHVDYSDQHGCGFNYWDVLLIAK